jgi:hypothetical protein
VYTRVLRSLERRFSSPHQVLLQQGVEGCATRLTSRTSLAAGLAFAAQTPHAVLVPRRTWATYGMHSRVAALWHSVNLSSVSPTRLVGSPRRVYGIRRGSDPLPLQLLQIGRPKSARVAESRWPVNQRFAGCPSPNFRRALVWNSYSSLECIRNCEPRCGWVRKSRPPPG